MRLTTLALGLLLPAAFAAGRLTPAATPRTPGPSPGAIPGASQGETPPPVPAPGEIPGGSDVDEPAVNPGMARSPFAALRAKATDQLVIDMLGAWRLDTFMAHGAGVDQNDIYGFVTIADEYMSISLHTRTPSPMGDGAERLYFQTSMGRWWFDDAGQFFAQSLIGHSNMDGERIRYEAPGTVREYTIEMPDEETLVMVRGDQARLIYKRLPMKGDNNAQAGALARRRARARGVDPDGAADPDAATDTE